MRTQQERTIKGYNLHICDYQDCDEWGWPELMPTWTVPKTLTTFQFGGKASREGFAHFFIDDYRFERLWNTPEKYVDVLSQYDGVLSPDYSTYTDMPLPMQAWNMYRSRALASYWQRCGIDVIPTLQWSDERSFDFAFRGLPEESVVAVSTVGVMRSKSAIKLFRQGMHRALCELRPRTVIMYGKPIDIELGALEADVIHYQNDNHRRVKKWEDGEHRAEARGKAAAFQN